RPGGRRDQRPGGYNDRHGPARAPVKGTWTRDRARSAVMNLLTAQAGRYPDLGLEEIDSSQLEPLDAAFARAIYGTVMRRWITLEQLIGQGLTARFEDMKPPIQAALLAAGAQMLFMDRVPTHAAVNEAVDWTRMATGRAASGLVNAALRRLSELVGEDKDREIRDSWADGRDEVPLSDGRAIVLKRPAFPTDALNRLAVATSCPSALLRTWVKDHDMAETRRLALHGIVQPPVILNTAHATAALPDFCTAHAVPGHHHYRGPHADLTALLQSRSDLWVQDPGSSLAVGSVTDLSPDVVIDACAGLGTKTRQLKAAFPDAAIIATDIDVLRWKTLSKVFEGDPQVTVISFKDLSEHVGKADLLLLDVPCSNTGVLARRPEARYRYTAERRDGLAAMQRQIIADAIPLLRDEAGRRGRILYSTCSLDSAENEQQARWAAQWHDFDLSRERRRRPEGGPGEPPERYSDGAYAMLLER
ncbi:MAG: hypothetical protein KDA21_07145, partial [Phycisphaerales bacterium]|nr:hypothetical protein [Phycisphaerales bacterium]